jgi:hypothetical protein
MFPSPIYLNAIKLNVRQHLTSSLRHNLNVTTCQGNRQQMLLTSPNDIMFSYDITDIMYKRLAGFKLLQKLFLFKLRLYKTERMGAITRYYRY